MATFSLGSHFADAGQVAGAAAAGSRRPHYTTGRILAAADLTADQQAGLARDRSIGRAAGYGVVHGLRVKAAGTTVTVGPGLGLSRSGDPVSLDAEVTLPLAVPLAEVAPPDPATFSCCTTTVSPGTGSLVATGAYLLCVRPACRSDAGACAGSWTVAGVEFRVVGLPAPAVLGGVEATAANRRNLLAQWCLGAEALIGSDAWAGLAADLFGVPAPAGLDALADLTEDDLPLAVFRWDGQQVAELDSWAARRRVVLPEPADEPWALLTGDVRIAAGQARFHQFTDQCAELVALQQASTARAVDLFGFLPPAGFLPVRGPMLDPVVGALHKQLETDLELLETDLGDAERITLQSLAERRAQTLERLTRAMDQTSGFDPGEFFGRLARFGGVLDWDVAEFALRDSWHRAPVRALEPEDEPEIGELAAVGEKRRGSVLSQRPFVFYLIRQNLAEAGTASPTAKGRRSQALFTGTPGGSGVQLYVFFVASWAFGEAFLPPVRLLDAFLVDGPASPHG